MLTIKPHVAPLPSPGPETETEPPAETWWPAVAGEEAAQVRIEADWAISESRALRRTLRSPS